MNAAHNIPPSFVSPLIRLLVADVDGTLLTPDKTITARARASVEKLREAGIRFTITSSRPPRGLKKIIDPLKLTEPIAAFNGGLIVTPDFTVLSEALLPAQVTQQIIEIISSHKIDAWLYNLHDWFVQNRYAAHVDHEAGVVGFEPVVLSDFESHLDGIGKIVAVTDDFAAIQRCEQEIHRACGNRVSATRSQSYYLDITHPDANKGRAITLLSELMQIPIANIATIGDGANDVLMFRNSGLSIAMGNASPEVQAAAQFVTSSNRDEGFASAVENSILVNPDISRLSGEKQ